MFPDLEDSVAPLAKPAARTNVVVPLKGGDWSNKTRVVRVDDLITVIEGIRARLDMVMLPKVKSAEQAGWLDVLLTQVEASVGLDVGRIGSEAQTENARRPGRRRPDRGRPLRLETVVFGPADFMASINLKSLVVGEQRPATTSATPTTTSTCVS